MKYLINQCSKLTLSKVSYTSALLLLLASMGGCVGDSGWDSGTIANTTATPRGPLTSLYCPNVGINDETCVLSDPNNPYRSITFSGNATDGERDNTKWGYEARAKASMEAAAITDSQLNYYLWATALAREPSGENQFYTAVALQDNYGTQGSQQARDQAKKAYRSFLDNFFDSITFDETGTTEIPLINWVAPNLLIPGAGGNFLYETQSQALADLDSWGYEADLSMTPPVITKKIN